MASRRRRGRLGKATLRSTAEIAAYTAYLNGTTVFEINRPAPGEARERLGVGVVPFGSGLAATGSSHVETSMTRQALWMLGIVAPGATDKSGTFGLEFTQANVLSAPEGFVPAQVTITQKLVATAKITTGVSPFTGRKRNYHPGRSGTIPFGRGTAAAQPEAKAGAKANTALDNQEYLDAVKAIRTMVGAIDATATAAKYTMTFKPELYLPSQSVKYGLTAFAPTT